MNKQRHVLLLIASIFFIFSFPRTSFANETTSQVGIFFTEKASVDQEDSTFEGEKELPMTSIAESRTSSRLPQTGERRVVHLLIWGLIFIVASLLVKNLYKMGDKRMNIKKAILTSLVSSSILLLTVNTVGAAPQDKVEGSSDGKGATSRGYIQLMPGDDKEGPTEPIKPTIPSGTTGNVGPLTIDNVAPLLFDTHKLEGKEQVYTSVVTDSNIQVTDNRGEESGWNLQVSQTPFIDVKDKAKILKGTKLTLPLGTLETAGANVSLRPSVVEIEVTEAPTVLMNAIAGSGAGTWASVFDKDEIKLTVPAGNKKGEYMSTVTWSLMDAPK